MSAEKTYAFANSKRQSARSASQGALFCWALLKGGVLCCLLLLPGDFNRSLESGSPLYAGCFLAFYSSAVVLYLWLQKSNPGYLKTEESRSLLEDGEMRRRSKDSDSSHGIEMRQRHVASPGILGPPKAEPELSTSVSAALEEDHRLKAADGDANSDTDDIQAAEDFVDKLSARIARRGPTQVESTAAAQGAAGEEAADAQSRDAEPHRDIVKRRLPPSAQNGLDEITLCVEEEGGGEGGGPGAAAAACAPRYCDHCRVTQLLRTKHCYDCGRCVTTFDHHCFWIGNCVGENNHRLFWWYLCFETVTVAWACSLAASTFQYTAGPDFLSLWFSRNAPSLLCLVTCLCFLLMLGALLFFHTYLIYTGQTTWEVTRPRQISYMRNVPKDIYPFSEGGCTNVAAVCCRSTAKPRVWPDPVGPYKETQRFWWIENEYYSCF